MCKDDNGKGGEGKPFGTHQKALQRRASGNEKSQLAYPARTDHIYHRCFADMHLGGLFHLDCGLGNWQFDVADDHWILMIK
jgi:hypothetical protein